MKNFIIIISFFLAQGCANIDSLNKNTPKAKCPDTFFSSEHKVYFSVIDNSDNLDNISYKANINNFNLNNGCYLNDQVLEINLSILFVINPEDIDNPDIKLPFYIAIVDTKNKLKKINYYHADVKVNVNSETNKYLETEVIENISMLIPSDDDYKLIIGFMIDKERLELLN